MKKLIVKILIAALCLGASIPSLASPVKGAIAGRSIGTSEKQEEEAVYKELFLHMMDNTLPPTVVFPAAVTNLSRAFAICSSTLEDVTFLAENPRCTVNALKYGCPSLVNIRMPNATAILDWGWVSNGSSYNLYIPKCRMFGGKTYIFDPGANAAGDVWIEELPCAGIMQITNFPGVHNNNAARVTFHGSDGKLTWNGSEWVFSAE